VTMDVDVGDVVMESVVEERGGPGGTTCTNAESDRGVAQSGTWTFAPTVFAFANSPRCVQASCQRCTRREETRNWSNKKEPRPSDQPTKYSPQCTFHPPTPLPKATS
jgi:hypothetical protein